MTTKMQDAVCAERVSLDESPALGRTVKAMLDAANIDTATAAHALDIDPSSMRRRLRAETPFRTDEVPRIARLVANVAAHR